MENKLAIVIPFYKLAYFNQTLESLNNQTNKNFKVYIGDDCSPESPKNLIKKYQDKLSIKYIRFNDNYGKKSLVKQWNRCLDLINGEEWVMFLPDDDMLSSNVVEEFYKKIEIAEKENVKVIRIPIYVVNDKNKIMQINKQKKFIEINDSYYLDIVKGKTGSSLGDNIFHTDTLIKSGKFIEFPKGWGSDHATILNVASYGKIMNLKESKFYFRMSGENISSMNDDGDEKMHARVLFAKWIIKNKNRLFNNFNQELCDFFYFKGEYYVLNEWKLNINILKNLYLLNKICRKSSDIKPILKILIKKLFK